MAEKNHCSEAKSLIWWVSVHVVTSSMPVIAMQKQCVHQHASAMHNGSRYHPWRPDLLIHLFTGTACNCRQCPCCYDTLLSLESGTIGVPKRQGRLRSALTESGRALLVSRGGYELQRPDQSLRRLLGLRSDVDIVVSRDQLSAALLSWFI